MNDGPRFNKTIGYYYIWKLVRDILLFISGLVGIAYEAAFAPSVNQTLLILFAAMIGLPGVIRGDEKTNPNNIQTTIESELKLDEKEKTDNDEITK